MSMLQISTVAIISKPKIAKAAEIVCGLLDWLSQRGIRTLCDEQTARYAGRDAFYTREELPKGADFVIVLGGDGTLLSAARVITGRDIPILAVNLRHLGFLTSVTLDQLYPELERVLRGEHGVSVRRMVDCELVRKDQIIARYSALNDV